MPELEYRRHEGRRMPHRFGTGDTSGGVTGARATIAGISALRGRGYRVASSATAGRGGAGAVSGMRRTSGRKRSGGVARTGRFARNSSGAGAGAGETAAGAPRRGSRRMGSIAGAAPRSGCRPLRPSCARCAPSGIAATRQHVVVTRRRIFSGERPLPFYTGRRTAPVDTWMDAPDSYTGP
jgi:hypothetical protein